MKIEYVKVGDYYLPNLTLPEEKREIGRWGMLRKVYMKEYKAGRYNYLLLTGKLDSYLADLNECRQKVICIALLSRWSPAFYIQKQYFLSRQKSEVIQLNAIDIFADGMVYYVID